METLFEYTFWLGLAILAIGAIWFLIRLIRGPRKRLWIPALVGLVGLGFMTAPAAIARQLPVDLGARERIVDGERHITLTGWDEDNYAVLDQKPDTVVLQMANSDVTDETLKHIADMQELAELDLNDTQVTDAGLRILASLPNLKSLRLRGTAVTDDGFRECLMPHETLKNLDLRQTKVSKELVDQWKAAGEGRRAHR